MFYLCSIKATDGVDSDDAAFQLLQTLIVFMWRVLVPVSLVVACVAGVRREKRVVKHLLRSEMSEGGQLFALSDQTKDRVFKSVGSLEALARMDDMSWFHRRVCCLRRRSSLREQILCSCETDDAVRCAESPVMLCQGQDDHAKLLACRKIPFRVQERLDKVDFESEADREIARSWIRTDRKLDSLRDNWHIFARDSPLTEQGLRALRDSVAQEDDDALAEGGSGILHWLTAHTKPGCCCACCHREPSAASGFECSLVQREATLESAENGNLDACDAPVQTKLLPREEQGFTVSE